MPSAAEVALCALAMLAISLGVGWPLARRLVEAPAIAWSLSPALGWAVFSGLALPALSAAGFSRATVAALCGIAIVIGIIDAIRGAGRRQRFAAPVSALAAAAALAVVPALGLWPKFAGGGVLLAAPMFDHSKIAIVDDIVRLGLPPGNPFFADPGPLAYYYLWHFSAAVVAALAGASGWEADIALTWFTGFASLALMAGLAVQLGGRGLAAPLVVLLSLAGSLWPLLRRVVPAGFLDAALSQSPWPHGWLFQASWGPQHLASASCGVLAVVLLSHLDGRRGWPLVPVLAVVVAAGFESSAWVGGVVFAASALPFGAVLLRSALDARGRATVLAQAGAAALLALALCLPLLRDEYAATAARQVGAGIALRPFAVLGPLVPEAVRRIADLPAWWALLLAIELPAIWFAGSATLAAALADRAGTPAQRRLVIGLALLAAAGLGIPWLFASTIANNDLGWRGVLPGIFALTVFAAAGLARWLARAKARAAAALLCVGLGVPGGVEIARENVAGLPAASAATLAGSPAMWVAARRHAAPGERVGNNPLFLADAVRWPVNISWALFADRRSCYAGWNLARAFVPLPEPALDRLERLFDRVFAGDATEADVRDLAARYECRVIVVTRQDGAWRRDPFATGHTYRLVQQQNGEWRIYRAVDPLP